MKVQKYAAGAVFVGAVAAGMFGAGTASAIGASVDVNGDGKSLDIGTGATTTQSGNASGNPSLAISVFQPASTSATGNATGNTLIAIDGSASVGGNSNGNTVLAVANKASSTGQGNKPGEVSVSLACTSLTGQADHVTLTSNANTAC